MIKTLIQPHRSAWAQLCSRKQNDDGVIEERVKQIITDVRSKGDQALFELTQRIEGVTLDTLRVADEEIQQAQTRISKELKEAIEKASKHIRTFHAAQLHHPLQVETAPGIVCQQRAVPIQRVGLYIPGGSAPLFSTVLMLAIPAQVAGCQEVCLCTPPQKDGKVAPEVLYAAMSCGVKEVYKVGGAQAIAAMAYGTAQIKPVFKIFGPGNRYVTLAKQLVSVDSVSIDMPAGPSEVMIIADESALPEFIAADMLSQCEHGADSQALAVVTSEQLAIQVAHALKGQLAQLSRESTAEKALQNSAIIVLQEQQEIIDFANLYAAEHLIISMQEASTVVNHIQAAGSIFLGNYTPESAGDYASGTNHTLPTSGWANSCSGVNTDSFVKKITIQHISEEGLLHLAPTLTTLAQAEGLDAHAAAVQVRTTHLQQLKG